MEQFAPRLTCDDCRLGRMGRISQDGFVLNPQTEMFLPASPTETALQRLRKAGMIEADRTELSDDARVSLMLE